MNSSTNEGKAPRSIIAKRAMKNNKEAALDGKVSKKTLSEQVAIVDNAQIVDKEMSQRNTSSNMVDDRAFVPALNVDTLEEVAAFEGGEMAFDEPEGDKAPDTLAPPQTATSKEDLATPTKSVKSGRSANSKRSGRSKKDREESAKRAQEEAAARRRATYIRAPVPKPAEGLPSIIKSEFDNREFKYLLLPNNMKVILISDPQADKCAASVEVQIGSLMDPEEFKGTAKFLQHMLLRGSKKYPKPDQWEEFLQRNGGSWNAFTTMTTTNFHFDVLNKGFDEGLDRFAQCFFSPVFADKSTGREIKHIHHQFKVALTNDFWHHTNLYMRLSHPESPINKFIFGNKEGLKKPEAFKAMKEFYNEFYSAELMTVCVSGNLPMAALEKKVAEAFKKVPFKEVLIPDFTNREVFPEPFGPEQCKKLVKSVSVRDVDELKIVWNVPFFGGDINRYHLRYFYELFGSESQNSILSYLKSEGWATFLQVQKKSIIKSFTKFEITIELTQKGFKNYQKVVEAVFAMAWNLKRKGPQDKFFNEANEIGSLNFAYQDRSKPMDQCIKVAAKLAKIPDEDIPLIIKHRFVRDKFDKEGVRELADMFVQPERVMIFLASKSFEKEGNMQYEQWMLTKFKVEPIEGDLLNVILNPNPEIKSKAIDLPPENQLIHHNFNVVPLEEEFINAPQPISIYQDTDIWFRQETKFRHPKGIVHMKLYTSDNGFGFFPESSVFAYVWAFVQQEFQHEYLYSCTKAGLQFNVEVNPDDLEFKWQGYSDHIQPFIHQCITNIISMRSAKARELEPMFNNAKNWLMRDWQGAQEDKTYRQALDLFPKMLYRVISREKDLHRMLENYKFSQFFRELQTWLHSGTMVWFVHGNFSKNQANDMVATARDLLNLEEVTIDQLAKVGPLILKDGTSTVYEERIGDKNNKQDCILAYYQVGLVKGDLKMSLCNNLLHTFMAIPFMQEMKSARNLDRVAARESYQRDCLGMWFLIQSDKCTSEYMSKCINDFLYTMKGKVKSFSKKDFETLKKAMADALSNQVNDFEQEDIRLWQEIMNFQFIFDRPQKCVALLNEITKDDFYEHFMKLFFSDESKRLDIQLVSEQKAKEQKKQYGQSKNEEMYKKVLKREKYEGTFEWFKAYSKYDEDNLKSALTEWRKDEEPAENIDDGIYIGSMPGMLGEQMRQQEQQIKESQKDDEELNQKFSEFKKLKQQVKEQREAAYAQSEAGDVETQSIRLSQKPGAASQVAGTAAEGEEGAVAGAAGADGENAPDAAAGGAGTKSTTTKRTFKSGKQDGGKKMDMKSEASKKQVSKTDVKSSNKLVGAQKKPAEETEYKSNTGLSKRGVQALLPTKDDKEVQLTKVSFNDAYDAKTNPNGYLNMLTEENHLMHYALKEKLQNVCKTEDIPDQVFDNQDWQGLIGFRQALAKYMEKYWFDRKISADNLCIQNGNGPSIESLISLFCNEGDTVIVPSPCNSSLFADLYIKSKVFVGAAQTSAQDNFEPTLESLEDAYEQAMMNGSKPKAILLLQPNNPTGRMLSPKCLQMCLQWAYEREIHLISNEVYAISLYEKQKMISMAQVWFDEQASKKNKSNKKYLGWLQNQVHITGGLSKDFGINGFAVGFIYTKNEDILAASRSTFGMLHQVSSHTQFLLQKILEDDTWIDNFVKTSKKRLTVSRNAFKDALKAADIPLFESNGTLMGWVDFRGYLKESSWEAENELWEELYKDCGWMIKRGREFATSEPGWFCVMLTSQNFENDEQMVAPFKELQNRLEQWKLQKAGGAVEGGMKELEA